MQDRRLVDEEQEFTGQTVVQKLFNEIAPQFADRPGGYTRIIKLPDLASATAAAWCFCSCCTEESTPKGTARRSAGLRRKRNERKHQFAGRVMKKSAKSEAAASDASSDSAKSRLERSHSADHSIPRSFKSRFV